jgi:hypothetical protein
MLAATSIILVLLALTGALGMHGRAVTTLDMREGGGTLQFGDSSSMHFSIGRLHVRGVSLECGADGTAGNHV